jgi:cytidine deaminase
MAQKEIHLHYQSYAVESELPATAQKLLQFAKSALDLAHAPYSNFQVGAAIQLSNGQIIQGSNQENAAYPSGLCAERTAIFYAGSAFPEATIEGILVLARKKGETQLVPACPCGACRQAMLEYEERQNKTIPIFFKRSQNEWVGLDSISSLLPFKFDSTSL